MSLEDMQVEQVEHDCPACRIKLDYNTPYPSCNECECCFCSEQCRSHFHNVMGYKHDYNKPLEDLS